MMHSIRTTAIVVLALWNASAAFGQCTGGTSGTLIPNASWNPASVPVGHPWVSNFPPTAVGATVPNNCAACPSLFSVTLCSNNFARMYMCPGNVYTISVCNTGAPWNSTITITNSGLGTSYAYDDDGCGPVNGLSTVTFSPSAPLLYYIRLFNDPCSATPANCALLEISCSPAPPPPVHDNPCGAIPVAVNAACTYIPTTCSWATPSTGVPSPGCSVIAGYDVWYSLVVPPSGNLAINTNVGVSTDMAMALYSAPACTGPFVLIECDDDDSPNGAMPFLIRSGLTPGSTVWLRAFPRSGAINAGSFEICAYEPVPPVNDDPCGAVNVPVTAVCTPSTYSTESATPVSAAVTVGAPGCGTPILGGDVWFQVTMPPSGSMTITTVAGSLTDMAMAVYSLSGSACGPGTLTAVGCNDNPPGNTMPSLSVSGVSGTVYYVRVWNKTADFGTFQICATPNFPPANDDPCGAITLPVNYGCLFTGYSNAFATNTSTTPPGTINVPLPTAPCATAFPWSDVWFRATVPPNGILQLDTDDGQLTNAAMAVYRVTSGSCSANNLSLTQIGCATGNSPSLATMPYVPLSGLVPGETVYIRIWRDGGTDGTFQLCARRTDTPPGACTYTLRMMDSAGDGWNGSTVTVCIDPLGPPPPVCTPYTVNTSLGTITFGVNVGDLISLTYTAAGGFQNQISYQLIQFTGPVYTSPSPPTTGVAFAETVDCVPPPAPPEDCVGAIAICNDQVLSANPLNTGAVADLNVSNRGCFSANERRGMWFTVTISASGQMAFTVVPGTPQTDYDHLIWGPLSTVVCPPVGPPIRCSWGDGPGAPTGLSYTATDVWEGVNGDQFTRYLDVTAGETYLMLIDDFYQQTGSMTITWNMQGGGSINCVVLPTLLSTFDGLPVPAGVELAWTTSSEQNSDHFLVQRSTDGSAFTTIGRVEAQGLSFSPTDYLFLDSEPNHGSNHYRLLQVDPDGNTVPSDVVVVTYRGRGLPIVVFPNPTKDMITATFKSEAEQGVRWNILDASSRVVLEGNLSAVQGLNSAELATSPLDAGSYTLVLRDPRGEAIGRTLFVKQ